MPAAALRVHAGGRGVLAVPPTLGSGAAGGRDGVGLAGSGVAAALAGGRRAFAGRG